jgi:DNA-3-methyladenine glycosylase II
MLNWTDKGSSISLKLPKIFNFQECLMYLTRSSTECLYHVSNHKVLRLLNIDGDSIVIEIACEDNTTLDIRFVNTTPESSTRMKVADYVSEWFDLEKDLATFYKLAQEDALLKPLIDQYFGLRIMGIPDLFEALCWAITGQQINLTFAYALKRKFVETFGDSMQYRGRMYWLFPTPEVISNTSVERLRQLQFTEKKAEYIIHVAKQMAAGSLTKPNLQAMDSKDAEQALVNIRGIGPWTANYVRMRCLRDPSAFPIADVGLHNAIKQRLQMDRKPTLEEIRQLSVNWKNWEAYATFYLWRSLYEKIA